MAAIDELKASGKYSDVDFQLVRVPFFLEPGYISKPPTFTESHETRMVRKFGSKEAFERVKASHGLIPRGAEVGLDASMGFTQSVLDRRIQSSTLNSHRLVLFITQKHGMEYAERLYDQLNQRHFLHAGVLNDLKLLQASVSNIGLDDDAKAEALSFLSDPSRGVTETLYLYEQTQKLGINSIPTLVIDGQYMVSGAARAEEIVHALEQAVIGGPSGALAFDRAVIA